MNITIYEKIKEDCFNANSNNPVEIIVSIMKKDYINMHGPEHHILDGACFLTAVHNAGAAFDLDSALDEMIHRGEKMPGATCGQWGVCGSAASVGAALAIIHETGPLSDNKYYQDYLFYVSRALENIAKVGGPRCCKRNAFLSIQTAMEFVYEQYQIVLPIDPIKCEFSKVNKQCKGAKCLFWEESILLLTNLNFIQQVQRKSLK